MKGRPMNRIIITLDTDGQNNVQVYSQTPEQERACDADVLESKNFPTYEKAAAYADKLSLKYGVEWQSN
jgi:hypothetical protein